MLKTHFITLLEPCGYPQPSVEIPFLVDIHIVINGILDKFYTSYQCKKI